MKKLVQTLITFSILFLGINGVQAVPLELGEYEGTCELTDQNKVRFSCTYSCNITKDDSYLKFNYRVYLESGHLQHELIQKSIETDDLSFFGFDGNTTADGKPIVGTASDYDGILEHKLVVSLYSYPTENDMTEDDNLTCLPVIARDSLSQESIPKPRGLTQMRTNQISIYKDPSYIPNDRENNENGICGLLGNENSETVLILKKIYKYLKILIPILIIILSIIDFIKVVVTGKNDDMKKAIDKLVKRIIVAIVFILVPAIIQILINISGITSYSGINEGLKAMFCIIG